MKKLILIILIGSLLAQDDNAALKGANAKLEAEHRELESRYSNTLKERDKANESISALQQQLEQVSQQNKK